MTWREPKGAADLDFYTWPTPNGRKVAIFLEEAGVAYNLAPVDTAKGEQFTPDFLAISPNNKIPVIVDHRFAGGPHAVFESGAILLHLAEREGKFLPANPHRRSVAVQWLMWQMGGFGPMLGQAHHFRYYAKETLPYAVERYSNEAQRLYRVLDRHLAEHEYVADEYSIADMAIWPWITPRKLQGVALEDFPNVARWNDLLKQRPGLRRGFDLLGEAGKPPKPTGDAWERLFGAGQFRPRD